MTSGSRWRFLFLFSRNESDAVARGKLRAQFRLTDAMNHQNLLGAGLVTRVGVTTFFIEPGAAAPRACHEAVAR